MSTYTIIAWVAMGLFATVGWVGAGLFVGKMFYKDRRRVIDLKREADNVAHSLGEWGFKIIPKLLTDVVVGDVESLIRDFRATADQFKDPAAIRAACEKLLGNLVTMELKDTATRQAWFDAVYNEAKAAGVLPTKA